MKMPARIAPGSRWATAHPGGRNVWEYTGRRDQADYVMRLVEAAPYPNQYGIGDEIRVERAWFVVRGVAVTTSRAA